MFGDVILAMSAKVLQADCEEIGLHKGEVQACHEKPIGGAASMRGLHQKHGGTAVMGMAIHCSRIAILIDFGIVMTDWPLSWHATLRRAEAESGTSTLAVRLLRSTWYEYSMLLGRNTHAPMKAQTRKRATVRCNVVTLRRSVQWLRRCAMGPPRHYAASFQLLWNHVSSEALGNLVGSRPLFWLVLD